MNRIDVTMNTNAQKECFSLEQRLYSEESQEDEEDDDDECDDCGELFECIAITTNGRCVSNGKCISYEKGTFYMCQCLVNRPRFVEN